MKRYVKLVPIYAMATERAAAIKRLKALSDPLEIHVMRLGIYDDSLDCKSHWINELATYLSTANDIRVKPNKKLNLETYRRYLVGGLGDTVVDAHVNVRVFKASNEISNQYPDFDEDSDIIINRVFHISQVIIEFVVGTLPYKNTLKKSDIYYYLKERV